MATRVQVKRPMSDVQVIMTSLQVTLQSCALICESLRALLGDLPATAEVARLREALKDQEYRIGQALKEAGRG